ncbi:FMN/FAD transporter, partial [Shigella flexneri]
MEIFFALQCEGLFICIPITLHSRRFRYAIKQKEHPMQQFAIAGAASVRPFGNDSNLLIVFYVQIMPD